MVDIGIFINNGNQAFGTTGKTITVNELPKSISLDFVAEELHHRMPLVPTDVIQQVLTGYAETVSRLIAEGFGIQYTDTKGNVLWRQYTDARLKCQSINLQKAKELMPGVVVDEESMVKHAGELVALAGVTLRPYVEVQQKFHELLAEYKPKYEVKQTQERAYVERKNTDGTSTDDSSDGNGGSGSGSGSGSGDGGNGGDSSLEP